MIDWRREWQRMSEHEDEPAHDNPWEWIGAAVLILVCLMIAFA